MSEPFEIIEQNKTLAKDILARPVLLKAWKNKLQSDNYLAIHVDVVFRTARVDEPSLPVDFRVSFRTAETRIYLKRGAAAKIDHNSVARGEQPIGTRETKHQRSASGSANADINLTIPHLRASASAATKGSESTSFNERIGKIAVQHMPLNKINGYAWISKPEVGHALEGSPWLASEPRFCVLNETEKSPVADSSTVVEVIVSHSDLVIDSIVFKHRPKTIMSMLSWAKRIAVHQFIARRLAESVEQKRNAEGREAALVRRYIAREA